MDLARSISGLLTWQWVVLILALSFHKSLRGLIDRLVKFSFGGKKRLHVEVNPIQAEHSLGRVKETAPPATVPPNIEAQQFTLRDEHGNRRAVLGVTDTNTTALTLYDPQGRDGVSLFLIPRGDVALMFYSARGEPRMMLAAGPENAGSGVHYGKDRLAVSLMVPPDGFPTLALIDRDGRTIWSSEG